MTIKQHGGIFGRNPSFNSVEVESLSIAGNAVPDASTILVDGDIGSTVQGYDADTAKLDAAQTFTAAQTFDENIVMANGKGIDFSATGDGSGTTSSELFDDYEEGTFTPAIDASTTSPTVTYSNQLGRYTKVGNRVHIDIQIQTSDYTAGTGNFRITGLPFTAISGAPEAGSPPMGFKVGTSAEARLKVEGGQTYCQMLRRSAGDTSTGWANAPSNIWTNASPTILVVSLTYVVA